MGRQQNACDREQKQMVIESEEAHEYGVRGKGLSGHICENLLKDFLKKEIPNIKFDSGVILRSKETGEGLKASVKREGKMVTKDISPQVDIIAYRGEPRYPLRHSRYQNIVAVHRDDVVLTIEVKKWTSPTDITNPEKYNRGILRIKGFTGKPHFFVTFRHFDRRLSIDKLKNESKADRTYVFSRYSKESPLRTEKFEEYIYPGELKHLVEDVKREAARPPLEDRNTRS